MDRLDELHYYLVEGNPAFFTKLARSGRVTNKFKYNLAKSSLLTGRRGKSIARDVSTGEKMHGSVPLSKRSKRLTGRMEKIARKQKIGFDNDGILANDNQAILSGHTNVRRSAKDKLTLGNMGGGYDPWVQQSAGFSGTDSVQHGARRAAGMTGAFTPVKGVKSSKLTKRDWVGAGRAGKRPTTPPTAEPTARGLTGRSAERAATQIRKRRIARFGA